MLRSWALAILGVPAFAVLVWFAGPLVSIGTHAPLASPSARLIAIALFTLTYLTHKLWSARHSARTNERIVSALASRDAHARLPPEAARLQERFATALAELQRARFGARGRWQFGRSYLYELPWYAIIGAPGAGKTTALLNAGTGFPLADKLGSGAVSGIGGTRHCDWWFTDRAVLLDTAGRYTTQDSDRVADREGWDAFLRLLIRTRPRQPLNGVLLAVSVQDLLELSAEELDAHARLLRERLDELCATLRVRMPVYVLLTKCDLLPGFVDWFGSLERRERGQAWGITFDPRARSSGEAVVNFASSFERLVEQLLDRLADRLCAERDLQRRARIYSLPGQLRALGEPLAALIRVVSEGAASGSAASTALLRGVYLTSGTQGGTPIDRLLSAFGRDLKLEQRILPPNRSTGGSFFVEGVLNDVVLPEAGLGGSRLRDRLLQSRGVAVSAIAVLALALAMSVWWISSYSRLAREMKQLEGDVARVSSVLASSPAAVDADPRPLLPALDATGELARKLAQTRGTDFIDITTPFRRKLAAGAHAAYERILLGAFQASVGRGIDTTLRTGSNTDVQYEALKAYEMLTEPAHFDAAGLQIFVASFWDSALASPLQPDERQRLLGHMQALLQAGAFGSGIRMEPALVDSVRNRLTLQPPGKRLALRFGVLLDAGSFVDFRVASLGSSAAALFVAADGRSAPRAVPGRYTLAAYRDVAVGKIPALAAQLADESGWVLGVSRPVSASDVTEVLSTYRASYARAWMQFLDDLRLKPAVNLQEANRQAQVLGSAAGPLVALLRAIVQQVPTRMPGGAQGPVDPVDAADRFAPLAALLARDASGSAPIDAVVRSIAETAAQNGAAAGQVARVLADAQRQPEPVRSMLASLAQGLSGEGPRLESNELSRQISAQLGVACIRLVAGHFPFDRRATADASFAEFARVFGPKGAFDQAFTELLADHVSTSSGNWAWKGGGAAPPARDLERFRAAARIRDTFFKRGSPRLALRMTFRPVDLDEQIDRFKLEIDGQGVRYAHGPITPTTVDWPGSRGMARIEATPAGAGNAVQFDGPWALLRLFDQAAVQDGKAPGNLRVVFDIGGRKASFDVAMDNGGNPFRLRELERFDCPIGGP